MKTRFRSSVTESGGGMDSTSCSVIGWCCSLAESQCMAVRAPISLNWLAFLNKYYLHGVLCDEMGLGG